MARTTRRTGTPNGWDASAAAVAKATALMEATQLVAKLQAKGIISPDDHEGAAATIEALTLVASPGGRTKKIQAAKQLLRF